MMDWFLDHLNLLLAPHYFRIVSIAPPVHASIERILHDYVGGKRVDKPVRVGSINIAGTKITAYVSGFLDTATKCDLNDPEDDFVKKLFILLNLPLPETIDEHS